MLLEMHSHTSRHSPCSLNDPVALVKQVIIKGLQGIIITEHHYLWQEHEIAGLRTAAGVPDYFIILAAQEVETDIGHVLVYGADSTIEEKTSLDELRKQFPHAALVWAHPFRNGKVPTDAKLLNPGLHGVEIFSSNHTAIDTYHALMCWHHLKFTAISGSDTHASDTAGTFPTLFDHPGRTIADVAQEIQKGRCRPFYKEIPRAGGKSTVWEIIMGTKGDDELRNRIILRNPTGMNKWKALKRSSGIISLLYESGFASGPLRVPRIIEVDEQEQIIVEEGQRGRSLFDLLLRVKPEVGARYLKLAAHWLAGLHRKKMRISGSGYTIRREQRRLASYRGAFEKSSSPFLPQAETLITHVRGREEELFSTRMNDFIQIHGDFHPKNIIIGQDLMHDMTTLHVSVIDFENSLEFLGAFDVACFISQFYNQFRDVPEVLERYRADDFIKIYTEECGDDLPADFSELVNLFRLRANLSIGAFLIRVGLGTSDNMKWLIASSMNLLEGSST